MNETLNNNVKNNIFIDYILYNIDYIFRYRVCCNFKKPGLMLFGTPFFFVDNKHVELSVRQNLSRTHVCSTELFRDEMQ